MIEHTIACACEEPVIDVLERRRAINMHTHFILKIAANHGAYIAGGFANVVASNREALLSPKKSSQSQWASGVQRKCDQIRLYLESGLSSVSYKRERDLWKGSCGDIDLWFRSKDQADDFLKDARLSVDELPNPHLICVEESKAKFAMNFTCFDETGYAAQFVQAITKFTGDPSDVTGEFDIYNAACYIEGNNVYVPNEWEVLNKNKLLHFNPARAEDHVYILRRFAKWKRKHGMVGLTPATGSFMNDKFDDLIKEFKDKAESHQPASNPFVDYQLADQPMSLFSYVQTYMEPFLSSFTNENLLKLSLYYRASRNPAFDELIKRLNSDEQIYVPAVRDDGLVIT